MRNKPAPERAEGRRGKDGRGFYLFHFALLCAFLLACGAYEARAGSERLWHGEKQQLVTPQQAAEWISEKWDLLFYKGNDRIAEETKPY